MTTTKQFGAKGWTPEKLGSLAGKTYVITGANAGAGFEATRVFLSKGAKVVMMNRNTDKSTAAIATLKQELGSDAEVTFVRMDLAVLAVRYVRPGSGHDSQTLDALRAEDVPELVAVVRLEKNKSQQDLYQAG